MNVLIQNLLIVEKFSWFSNFWYSSTTRVLIITTRSTRVLEINFRYPLDTRSKAILGTRTRSILEFLVLDPALGNTAFHLICKSASTILHHDLIQMETIFRKFGLFDLHTTNHRGNTALHLAWIFLCLKLDNQALMLMQPITKEKFHRNWLSNVLENI